MFKTKSNLFISLMCITLFCITFMSVPVKAATLIRYETDTIAFKDNKNTMYIGASNRTDGNAMGCYGTLTTNSYDFSLVKTIEFSSSSNIGGYASAWNCYYTMHDATTNEILYTSSTMQQQNFFIAKIEDATCIKSNCYIVLHYYLLNSYTGSGATITTNISKISVSDGIPYISDSTNLM